MDTDIRELLDRSFGDGPPTDDVDLLVDRGHRAVRRRRVAGAALGVAAAVVVAGVAIGGIDRTGDSAPPPAGPGPSQTTSTASAGLEPPIVDDASIDPIIGVQLQDDGVHVHPDVEVLAVHANPWSVPAPSWSLGLEYRKDGETHWFIAHQLPTEPTSATISGPAEPGSTFDAWADQQLRMTARDQGYELDGDQR